MTDPNPILTDQNEILRETCRFYETLYTQEQNKYISNDINYFTIGNIRLSQDQSNLLEGQLTYTEITSTLKKIRRMANLQGPTNSQHNSKVFWS